MQLFGLVDGQLPSELGLDGWSCPITPVPLVSKDVSPAVSATDKLKSLEARYKPMNSRKNFELYVVAQNNLNCVEKSLRTKKNE